MENLLEINKKIINKQNEILNTVINVDMDFIVKKLNINHKKDVLNHFLRLDSESIHSRFCTAMKDDNLKNYVEKINFSENGIFGVFNRNLDIVGVGEIVNYKTKTDNKEAEIGFSVEKEYQGKGLGNKLMQKMVRYAKINNIDTVYMYSQRSNNASIHLAKKYGLETRFEGYESIAKIDVQKNNETPISETIHENIDNHISNMVFIHKNNLKLINSQNNILNEAFVGIVKIMFSLRPKLMKTLKKIKKI